MKWGDKARQLANALSAGAKAGKGSALNIGKLDGTMFRNQGPCRQCGLEIGPVSHAHSSNGPKFCSYKCSTNNLIASGDTDLFTEPKGELGNLMFGNSRGQHPLNRHMWSRAFEPLWNVMEDIGYEDIANDVFSVTPYYWGDCTCDADHINSKLPEDTPDEKYVSHRPTCKLVQSNFVHKKSGLELQWYKYPFRDSYSNKRITAEELASVIQDCVKVIKDALGEKR